MVGAALLKCALRLLLGGIVVPVLALVLHDVGCDSKIEDHHETDAAEQEVADEAALDVEVHEVLGDEECLDEGDAKRRRQGDLLNP